MASTETIMIRHHDDRHQTVITIITMIMMITMTMTMTMTMR